MNKYGLPYNVLRNPNSWDNAPRQEAVAAWILASGITSSAIVANVIAFVAITAVTSWAVAALTPKPDLGSLSGLQGLLVNKKGSTNASDFVYGTIRKGGTVIFQETSNEAGGTQRENLYLHQVIALAGHEVDAIEDIYINDEIVTLDGDGFVTDPLWALDSSPDGGALPPGPLQPAIRIKKYTGSQTAADPDLLAETSIDSTFIGRGIAYIYVRMEYDRSTFANGIPLFTARLRGKKVYDPRTGNTAFSNNAALCIRDYLTSSYGLNDSSIDDTYFSTAADDCDEFVATAGGGTEKRYTVDGVISSDTQFGTALQKMTTACAGTLFWGTGKWRLVAGVYRTPVLNFTLDDFRGPINGNPRNNLRDQFNIVRGSFIDEAQRWVPADFPQIYSSTFVAEDGGEELPLDLELPFTTSASRAQRIAKLTLFRSREQMTIEADFSLKALSVEVGDTITLTNERYGWTNKEFEVSGWSFFSDGELGDLRVRLTLREISSAVFDWNAEESDILNNNTNFPVPNAGLTINNLAATGGGRLQGDGTFINSAIVSWSTVVNPFKAYYEIEWKATADSTYNSTRSSVNSIELTPLVDGVEYMIRVRVVTVSGVVGPWSEITFTGGGDITAPGLPTDVTATGHFKYINISWTNPADTDLNYVEIYENTTNTTVAATLIGKSSGDSFVRTNLGLEQTRYYFLKAVDYSGNKSDFTTGVSATTTYLDDPDFENGIYTLFKDQGLYAIRDVTGLPTSGAFTGEKVFNRTDGKLYTWTGTAWEATVSDVGPGSITATEIADDAITTPKLAANAVTAANILGGTITGDKIAANTITGGLIAASGIITNSAQINDAVITNAKISDLSANKINAGTIAVDYLPGLTSIAQTITGSNISLVASTPSQYLLTQTLSGIRAGTKVVGILTLNAYSTTSGGPGSLVGCTMEIVPQNISGLTSHTFQKNNHPVLGISSSFMVMQTFIGTGTATGTSCSVQFRLGTAFTGETGVMLAGASLTLLGYEV